MADSKEPLAETAAQREGRNVRGKEEPRREVGQGSRAGGQDAPNQNAMVGTGTEGTSEREERITGSVGVRNKKGELVNQGSTSSPKGGAGYGREDQ